MTVNLQLRVSFFDSSLDTQASPIIFSQEVSVPGNSQNKVSVCIPSASLPCLYSAHNTFELAKQSRLLMFIWACGPEENFPKEEMLLGQVNIKMSGLSQQYGVCMMEQLSKICLSNSAVGMANIRLQYKTEQRA